MFSGKIGGSLDIPRKKCEGGARDTVVKLGFTSSLGGQKDRVFVYCTCTVHVNTVSGIRHTLLSVVQ